MNTPAAPDSRQVTVLGAGIVGVCAAAFLQQRGYEVTLVDRDRPGMGTSYGNAGSLSPSAVMPVAMPGMLPKVPGWLLDPLGPLHVRWRYLPRVSPWLLRFLSHARPGEVARVAQAMSSLLSPVFERYEEILEPGSFHALIERNGCLYVYESAAELEAARRGIELRRRLGATLEEIGPDEIRQLEPALDRRFKWGIFAPDNGRTLNPQGLVETIADQVVKRGGKMITAKVSDIELGETGATALVTPQGTIPVERLVLAAGAWSKRLADRLGHRVPLETQRGYHVTLPDPGITVNRTVMWNRRSLFANPMAMGLRVAGTVELAGLGAAPNYQRADRLMELAQSMFPDLNTEGRSRWMGHRPCLPDSLPVIDRSRQARNVVFAFGHQHVGMCGGAPTGRLVAELMDGDTPSIDLSPFRVDRF